MPTNLRIVPLLAGSPGKWSINRTRAALELHETGDFSESAQLADASKRFYRTRGAINTRTGALKSRGGLPFTVEPSDFGDRALAERVANDCRRAWWSVCPETTIAQIHEDAIQLEAAVGRIEWHTVRLDARTWWMPKLIHLPAYGLSYREDEGAWYYATREGPVKITPGDGDWFLHLPGRQRPNFGGAVMVNGPIHTYSSLTERGWLRFCEKHGLPMLGIKEPLSAQDDVGQVEKFYGQFKKIGSEPIVREPKGGSAEEGWEVRWIEANGTGYQSLRGFLEYAGDAAEYTITGMTPRGDQPRGGDGESVRERVRVEYLSSDAEPLTNSLRAQVWAPFGRFNYEGWEDEIAPWGRWDTRPPTDLKSRAETLTAASKAIADLRAQGIDVTPILEEFKLKLDQSGRPQDPQPLYQYHFQFGVVTTNEARARLGLPPIAGGDEPPKPIAVPPVGAAPEESAA